MNRKIKRFTFTLLLISLFSVTQVFGQNSGTGNAILESLNTFWASTGFANFAFKNLSMIAVGIIFIILAVKRAGSRCCCTHRLRDDRGNIPFQQVLNWYL